MNKCLASTRHSKSYHVFDFFFVCDEPEATAKRMGCTQCYSVKPLIISALLVLVAWLRWRANTGKPYSPEWDPDYWGRVSPRPQHRGSFSWKRPELYGVSEPLTIWRHIYKAFTCWTKAQTELQPQPYSLVFYFLVLFSDSCHLGDSSTITKKLTGCFDIDVNNRRSCINCYKNGLTVKWFTVGIMHNVCLKIVPFSRGQWSLFLICHRNKLDLAIPVWLDWLDLIRSSTG